MLFSHFLILYAFPVPQEQDKDRNQLLSKKMKSYQRIRYEKILDLVEDSKKELCDFMEKQFKSYWKAWVNATEQEEFLFLQMHRQILMSFHTKRETILRRIVFQYENSRKVKLPCVFISNFLNNINSIEETHLLHMVSAIFIAHEEYFADNLKKGNQNQPIQNTQMLQLEPMDSNTIRKTLTKLLNGLHETHQAHLPSVLLQFLRFTLFQKNKEINNFLIQFQIRLRELNYYYNIYMRKAVIDQKNQLESKILVNLALETSKSFNQTIQKSCSKIIEDYFGN